MIPNAIDLTADRLTRARYLQVANAATRSRVLLSMQSGSAGRPKPPSREPVQFRRLRRCPRFALIGKARTATAPPPALVSATAQRAIAALALDLSAPG
jgi:hypothetical protein